MSWVKYLVVFKSKSSIHIGYRQVSFLKTTRYYIPGTTITGAISSVVSKLLYDKPNLDTYNKVDSFIKTNVKPTYFYPSIILNDTNGLSSIDLTIDEQNYIVFLPEYRNNGLNYGNLTKEEFEQIFITSFVSTAMNPKTKSSEEGSLHETELIKNKVKIKNKIFDVYWIGYLFFNINSSKDNISLKKENEKIVISNNSNSVNFNDILENLQLGGERNYGFGLMDLILFSFDKSDSIFNNWYVDINDEIVFKFKDQNTTTIFNHLEIKQGNNIKYIYGELEPLISLIWSEKGPGHKISKPKICLTPGTKLEGTYNLILNENGILSIDLK